MLPVFLQGLTGDRILTICEAYYRNVSPENPTLSGERGIYKQKMKCYLFPIQERGMIAYETNELFGHVWLCVLLCHDPYGDCD